MQRVASVLISVTSALEPVAGRSQGAHYNRTTHSGHVNFASIFNSNSIDMSAVPNTTETSIYTHPDFEISTDEVLKALHSLKSKKKSRTDKIYPKLLKEISSEILSPLKMLFNMFL